VCVCTCILVCARTRARARKQESAAPPKICVFASVCLHLCVCVCVCVCTDKTWHQQRLKTKVETKICVCLCVCMYTYIQTTPGISKRLRISINGVLFASPCFHCKPSLIYMLPPPPLRAAVLWIKQGWVRVRDFFFNLRIFLFVCLFVYLFNHLQPADRSQEG
jgi:hypothetical protein